MQIVIDIDEETYNEVCWRGLFLCPRDEKNLVKAIKSGTPLPKGHGRLIDADKLKADNPRHMNADVPYVTEVTVEEIIDDAPTIIEADKEIEDRK